MSQEFDREIDRLLERRRTRKRRVDRVLMVLVLLSIPVLIWQGWRLFGG